MPLIAHAQAAGQLCDAETEHPPMLPSGLADIFSCCSSHMPRQRAYPTMLRPSSPYSFSGLL